MSREICVVIVVVTVFVVVVVVVVVVFVFVVHGSSSLKFYQIWSCFFNKLQGIDFKVPQPYFFLKMIKQIKNWVTLFYTPYLWNSKHIGL